MNNVLDGEGLPENTSELNEGGAPSDPQPRGGPSEDHPHRQLWLDVRRALFAIPTFFRTKLEIAGVRATDIHSLNSSLGASIEQSVVDQLNELRDIWDPVKPDGSRIYRDLAFKRQSTNWPDVLLTSGVPEEDPVLGIELKGWFVLAKEGEPSFRYKVNPNVCTDLDLVAVYPWNLDEVLSGKPFLMPPFVAEARYAAEARNHYWQYGRNSTGETGIRAAVDQGHYPKRGDRFSDEPISDAGKNFGRASRAGIMNDFISATFEEHVAGIPLSAWNAFFKTFREGTTLTEIAGEIRSRRAPLTIESEQEEGLAYLLRRMLDYIERVSGNDFPDIEGSLTGESAKITAVVPTDQLREHFTNHQGVAEMILLTAGSFSITASAGVGYVQSRLSALESKAPDKVRITLELGDDDLFHIKGVAAA